MSALAMTVLSSLIVVCQADGRTAITGTVVDSKERPVAGVEVLLSCGMAADGTVPTLVTTRTGADGRFQLPVPSRDRLRGLSWYSAVWACDTRLAMTVRTSVLMQNLEREPLRLVLREISTRTVTIRGPDGKPVAGAQVIPRSIHGTMSQMGSDTLPDELARRFAAATDNSGKAVLKFLAARDDLVAVRVVADSIGAQDFLLTRRLSFRTSAPEEYEIALKPTSYLTGQIVDGAGRPIAGVPVAVWSQGEIWLSPTPAQLPGEPLRTAADGSFQTPPSLLAGSTYRVVVQVQGSDPILSDWITVLEKPVRLGPMMLQVLRTITGRVSDRQGRPLAGVEVSQSGDGPEPTSARSDGQGRFSLGGFRAGPVFVFARGAGFRFHGQLVAASAAEAELVLTRTSETPARSMATLPDPIPLAESRKLAREIIEPYLKFVLEKGDDSAKYWALRAIIPADPPGVLERLDSIKFERAASREQIRALVVLALAQTDGDEAASVAESIPDAGARAGVLVDLADALSDSERLRRLSVLAQAALQAKAAANLDDRLFQMGEVGERLYELGEIDKAKVLLAEGRTLAGQFADKSSPIRGLFAIRLARVDLPAALAIVNDQTDKERADGYLGNIAARLAVDNPAEAERILDRIDNSLGRTAGTLRICHKMAAVDPVRARRIAERTRGAVYRAEAFIFLALGQKGRDLQGAVESFQAGLRELDRYAEEETEDALRGRLPAGLLPVVEGLDPALVPEIFWRVVALRPPSGDPRKAMDYPSARLAVFMARYDREVASVLFQPVVTDLQKIDDPGTRYASYLDTWALLDPKAAAIRIKKMTPNKGTDANANWTITQIVQLMSMANEARWKSVWRSHSGLERVLYDRDVW
jgi:Carboxypeptidase regulatory-like domain